MMTQRPIAKSHFSDIYFSNNANVDWMSRICFCAKCINGSGFHFTGKEKDPLRLYLQSGELCRARLTSPLDLLTGLSYFGARYLDYELMTMWLSVDLMSDKYPSISPYAYCAWNPLKLVDPVGEEMVKNDDNWKYNTSTGRLTWLNNKGGLSQQSIIMVHNEDDLQVIDQVVSFRGDITRMFDYSIISPRIDGLIESGAEITSGVTVTGAGLFLGSGLSALSAGTATPLGIAVGGALVAAGDAQVIDGLKNLMSVIENIPNNISKHNYFIEACKVGTGVGASFIQNGKKGVFKALRDLSISSTLGFLKWYNAVYPTYKGIPKDATVKKVTTK